MTVQLTQASDAAFPDRGTVGLRAIISPGPGGRVLRHELPSPQPRVHARVLCRVAEPTSGPVRIMGGRDPEGGDAWWVRLEPGAAGVTLQLVTGPSVTAPLPAGLGWRCIEAVVDAGSQTLALTINGVALGAAQVAGPIPATADAWVGAIPEQDDTTGELHLDEWVLADGPIGVPTVAPASPHADDPARWVLVYRRNDADSTAFAEAYRARRGLPHANLIGLDLPGDEAISAAEYADLADAVNTYLGAHGLADRVVGVLLGYGVPGYATGFGIGVLDAIGALLHTAAPGATPMVNPDGPGGSLPDRPTAASLAGRRLTARIDAPSLAEALALLDRADTIRDPGVGDGEAAGLWLDPSDSTDPALAAAADDLRQWAAAALSQHLRLPMTLADPGVNHTTIERDGFAWGFASVLPPTGFFGTPAGNRVFCGQFVHLTVVTPTLRDAGSPTWAAAALGAGYASAGVASRSYDPGAIPRPGPFFEALRRGWTLAEAWYLAQPRLREALHLVGDPLMTVALPRAGWDVFGPLASLEALDPESPVARRRLSERSVEPGPAAPAGAVYVVRRVDELGRSEAGLTLAVAEPLPPGPLWPAAEGWAAEPSADGLLWRLGWERPAASLGVTAITLEAEPVGGVAAPLAELDVPGDRAWAEAEVPPPAEPTRYRFRITGASGASIVTPWSAVIEPPVIAGATLTLVEPSP